VGSVPLRVSADRLERAAADLDLHPGVGQRQSSAHAELRAEHDHDSISRLLYHQELQERILIEIAGKIECDVSEIKGMVANLAAEDSSP